MRQVNPFSADATSGYRRHAIRIVLKRVIVEHAQFITHVDEGNAAVGTNQVVDEQNSADSQFSFIAAMLLDCQFQPSQRGARATDTPILIFRVVLKNCAARKTTKSNSRFTKIAEK